jgi:hypothetical protein
MTRAFAAAILSAGLLAGSADARAANATVGDICKADNDCASDSRCGSGGRCEVKPAKSVVPLYPILHWQSEQHGHKQRLISIFGSYERDDSSSLRQSVIFFPAIYHRSDRKRTVNVVVPIFTNWTSHDGGSSGVIAGPVYFSRDPHGSSLSVFPLYWRFHDDRQNATTQLIFPIAGWHHHDGASGGFVGPIYSWSSKNSDSWGAGIAPILMFGRSGPRRHVLLLPIFGHVSDSTAGTQTTVVGPLYVHTTPDGGDGGLFPLVFAGKHKHYGYMLIPGLYFHKGNDDGTLNVLGPLFFGGGRRWVAGLFPLFSVGGEAAGGEGRSHQIIPPLLLVHFHNDKARTDRLLIGPIYHRRDGNETANALFPLFYLRQSPESAFGLWIIGGHARANGVSTTVVGPFVRRTNEAAHSSTTLLFPLLAIHDAPNYSVRVVFPILWRIHDGDETDTALFPLYFRGRSPTRRWDALFPLFIHAHTTVADTTIVGPVWARTRPDGSRGGGLFPLFAFNSKVGAGGKRSSWFGMPGVYADSNEFTGKSNVWALLFYRAHRPDGYQAGFIPLLFAWRKGTTTRVLGPLFYHSSDPTKDVALDYFLVGYYGHDGKARYWGLIPLVFESTHKDGTFAAGIFPLFYFGTHTDGSTLVTPLGGWATHADSKRIAIGPVYYRRDAEVHAGGFLPLFYHQRNVNTGARTSFGLPLYFDTRGGDGRELQEYTPLVWRYHTVEQSTILGLPLFLDVHEYGESRATLLLPLFFHSHNKVTETTNWAFPPLLTWWRSSPDGKDWAFFPLIYSFGGKNPTTIVAPFLWDFKRGESRTTVFFPLGAKWHRPDGDHLILPFVYFKRGLGTKEGSWYLNIFPLLAVGRPTKSDVEWYAFEGLFGYSRKGRNRNLRLFWVLDFALEPVKAQDLSWFGATPPSQRELF